MQKEKTKFEALTVVEKQKRIRISEYAGVLYKSALRCQMEIQNIKAKTYLKEEYIDAVINATLYCNIDNKYSDIEDCVNDFEMLFLDYAKDVDAEIKKIEEIFLLREIFKKAVYIDDYISKSRSEIPLNDLIRTTILDESENPELKLVFEISIHDIKPIYLKHLDEIQTIMVPKAFVRRRKNRPMMLKYDIKPYLNDISRCILVAKPSFLDKNGQEMSFDDLRDSFNNRGMLGDLFSYFLYEAADMIKRLEAHDIYVAYLELELLPGTVKIESLIDRYKEMFNDFEIDKNAIRLVASAYDSENRDKQFLDTVKEFTNFGVVLRTMTDDDKYNTIHDANQIIQIIEEDI